MRTVTFFRLCSRAPWTTSASVWLMDAPLYPGEQTFDPGSLPRTRGSGSARIPTRARGLRIRDGRGRGRGLRGRGRAVVAAAAGRLGRLHLAADLAAGVLHGVDVDVRRARLEPRELSMRQHSGALLTAAARTAERERDGPGLPLLSEVDVSRDRPARQVRERELPRDPRLVVGELGGRAGEEPGRRRRHPLRRGHLEPRLERSGDLVRVSLLRSEREAGDE